jgi:NACHT domain-containing protein
VVVAVVGAPGSGKTTLLRHTARQLCRASRGRRRTVPILLYLRDHVAAIRSNPKIPLAALHRDTLDCGLSEPAGWFEQKLRAGDCVVLLDGLDEVAQQEDRREVADWVERQIKQHPKNDYVITSRPHAYRSARINGATVLQVRSFTDEQVAHFIRGWYLAVEMGETGETVGRRKAGTVDAAVRKRAKHKTDDLLDRLSRAPGLYDLTVNPLLLTMIINVHREQLTLPGSRAHLYDEICQAMLGRQQEVKKLPIELGGKEKELLLSGLAFTMMQRRVRDLPHTAVLTEIRTALRHTSTTLTAEDFLTDVKSDGLLIERENEQYSFVHHTFQEYLAANHIRDAGRPQILANSVDDDWWKETTLLYAARSDIDPIIKACLDSGSVTALSLAFDCAKEGGKLAPELRDRLDKLLDSAFTHHADRERRRLIVHVLLARHLRHLIRTDDNSRVCAHPITEDIYWLYRLDTNGPAPDGPTQGEPGPDRPHTAQPVTGVRGSDALAFILWVNSITVNELGYRLPNRTEIEDPAVHRALNTLAPRIPPLSTWLEPTSGRSQPLLWTPAGTGHPYIIDAVTLKNHVIEDVECSTPTLTRLLLLRAIVTVRILACGLDLVPVRNLALDHVLDCAFDLNRTLHHAHNLIHQGDLKHALDRARDLNDTLGRARRDRGTILDRARTLALELAGTLTLDLARTHDHAHPLDLGIDAARALDADDALESDRALDRAFDRALGRVMGSALSYALADVLRQDTPTATWPAEFSRVLIEQTAIGKTSYLVSPDTLMEETRSGRNALLARLGPVDKLPTSSWAYHILDGLEETALPIFTRQQPLTADSATALRLAALCLATEADTLAAGDTGSIFRGIAAGVTLLERRANGQTPPTETIILATT